MAFGNKSDLDLLVSCIRNSVIVTSEETGQCELILPQPASKTFDVIEMYDNLFLQFYWYQLLTLPSTLSCSHSSWFTSPACITSSQFPFFAVAVCVSRSAFYSRLKSRLFHKYFLLSLSGSIWTTFADVGFGPDCV